MTRLAGTAWRGVVARAWVAGLAVAGLAPAAVAQQRANVQEPSLAQERKLAQQLKIMAPAAPGGGWDQTARAMQAALTASGIAGDVEVTNVPGAGGSTGIAEFVKSAKGDANQLMITGAFMVGALILNKSPVTLADVTPIARLTSDTEAIVVPASSPIRTAKDLVAALKADPARVTWAGGSAGGVDHIAVGLFAKAVGADPTKVNYIPFPAGGEALAAVLAGQVTAAISGYGEFEGPIKAGKLRLIGITRPERLANIDGPTLMEQGIDLEIGNWRAVVAAPGISPLEKKALAEIVDAMVKSPTWIDAMKSKGWDNAYLSGDGFARFLADEQVRIADTLKSIGLAK